MAKRLGKIFGTEEDKVNCPFYFKIGACRHGDKCVRIHNKPTISQTLIFSHMYQNPPATISIAEGHKVSDEALKESIRHFEDFYEEVFLELSRYGEIIDLNVCDNLGDHLIGNVYAKFATEEEAEKALKSLYGKYYSGKPIIGEFSPVTDFRESRCRQYDDGSCGRGGFCNFMHLKYISKEFKKSLFEQMYEEHPDYKDERKRPKSAERSRKRRRRNSSSESDLGDRTSEERMRIIEKWNKKYEKEQAEEMRKKKAAEATINFIVLQKKLQEKLEKIDENREKDKTEGEKKD